MSGRILFLSGEYPPMRGGVGDYTAHLVAGVAAAGWESAVLTSRRAGGTDDPRVLARIDRWDWTLAQRVRQAITEVGADLVHIQYQTGAFAMHPAVNLLPRRLRRGATRCPVLTTFHDLLDPYLFPKAGPARRWVTRALARGSTAVVATNELDRGELVVLRGNEREPVLIPIGSNLPVADGHDPAEVRSALGLEEGECAVGFFGFLTQDKGVDLLLDALESLPGGRRVRLILVGGTLAETDLANAAYLRDLRGRIAATSVPVTSTGYLAPEEVARTLAALDLIVLPFRRGASLRNGTLVAAARSGTAVLTTDPQEHDSLAPLAGGESLWLVPPGDAEALRHGINVLLGDPGLRRRLATAAQAAARVFDWEAIVDRHIALYECLLGRVGDNHGRD